MIKESGENLARSDDMQSSLRDRVAKTIWKKFQNTPPIEATDDEWESWWGSEDEPGQRFYRDMADAVIAELGLQKRSETGEMVDRDGGEPIRYRRSRYVTEWTTDE